MGRLLCMDVLAVHGEGITEKGMLTEQERKWLDDLEAKAGAATPGPWMAGEVMNRGTVVRGYNMIIDCRHTPDEGCFGEHNAAFIAAANPQTVQRLVEMVAAMSSVIAGMPGIESTPDEILQDFFEAMEPKE